MNYIVAALVISSLALAFSIFGWVVLIFSGKKVFKVFTSMNKNLEMVNTNFSGIISQNNSEHENFKRVYKEHDKTLERHGKLLEEHEDILRPRKQIKKRTNGNFEGRN